MDTGHDRSKADIAGALPDLAGLQAMLKQAQQSLSDLRAEGVAGGGAVRVTMSGERRLTGIKIDPRVLADADPESLEELILAAANEAFDSLAKARTGAVGSALGLPGLFGEQP
jgi:DNA-binding YbaB/EbfC family protein